jgi:hypothetical protein
LVAIASTSPSRRITTASAAALIAAAGHAADCRHGLSLSTSEPPIGAGSSSICCGRRLATLLMLPGDYFLYGLLGFLVAHIAICWLSQA